MLPRRWMMSMLALVALIVVTACGNASEPDAAPRDSSEPPDRASEPAKPAATSQSSEDEATLPEPVELEEAVPPLRLNVYSRSGYWRPDGTLMIDVLEGDLVHATAMIDDEGWLHSGDVATVDEDANDLFEPRFWLRALVCAERVDTQAQQRQAGDRGQYRSVAIHAVKLPGRRQAAS